MSGLTHCRASTFGGQPDFVHVTSFVFGNHGILAVPATYVLFWYSSRHSPIGSFGERERNYDSLGHEQYAQSEQD
jgi:hypothetical protein